jgi:SAM-dependent methyltransferase
MSEMGRRFAGSMPEFYDRFLVPLMFAPFARHMAKCLDGMPAGDLLEIAAGTGIVARELVRTLPEAVQITATDINPAMVDQARTHADMDRVTWRDADAANLPFADQSFDKVVCQFGVMFFPDKHAAFREIRRVLRPGGEFLFNVWGDRDGTIMRLSSEVGGRFLNRPWESLLAPEYNDAEAVISDLAQAGFGKCAVEQVDARFIAASAQQAAIATCHGGLLRHHIDTVMPHRLDEITSAVADAIRTAFGTGRIDSPLRAILFACVREELSSSDQKRSG